MNRNHEIQGSFTGVGRAITDDGKANDGIRDGVWTRDGSVELVCSLDDVLDDVVDFCVETWILRDDSVKFEFSRAQK